MASHPQERLLHLRRKIKIWEKDFAELHNGIPPSKQDIDANAKIAARYSEYHKLKKAYVLEPRRVREPQHKPLVTRQPNDVHYLTPKPNKVSGSLSYESTSPTFPTANPFISTPEPSPFHLRKWVTKEYVSPTPQKNGKVLGIFDRLPGSTPTPTKQRKDFQDEILAASLAGTLHKTASLLTDEFSDGDDAYTPLDPNTPSRKRRYEFQTPVSKKQRESSHASEDPFATPLCFRTRGGISEIGESGSPPTPRLEHFIPPRRLIGKVKPLSALVKELRELEDSYQDDDLEVLREMESSGIGHEMQHMSPKIGGMSCAIHSATTSGPQMDTQDDPPADSGAIPTEQAYRKKGQRRQTRRIKLRPVHSRADTSVEAFELKSPQALQLPAKSKTGGADTPNDIDEIYASDDGDSDSDHIGPTPNHANEPTDPNPLRSRQASSSGSLEGSRNTAKIPNYKKKMMGPDRHANYKRLKIQRGGRSFKGKYRR